MPYIGNQPAPQNVGSDAITDGSIVNADISPSAAIDISKLSTTVVPTSGATLTGALSFGDSVKAQFGAGNDLQIFHDGSNSYINELGTGDLYVRAQNTFNLQKAGTSEYMLKTTTDGAVALYYDNDLKFNTQSAGVNVFGILTSDNGINVNNASGYASLELGGLNGAFIDMKAPFSDDYDGRLQYTSNQLFLTTNADEPIQLRHNNTTRFATTSVGADVTGELIADSYNETYAAVTSSSNATTVNCEAGNAFSHTLTENTTFTFSNPPASGTAYSFSIEIIQDASASGYTITWPSSVDWPAATAPTLTATASAKDVFVFTTRDGGTNWYGFTAGQALG